MFEDGQRESTKWTGTQKNRSNERPQSMNGCRVSKTLECSHFYPVSVSLLSSLTQAESQPQIDQLTLYVHAVCECLQPQVCSQCIVSVHALVTK